MALGGLRATTVPPPRGPSVTPPAGLHRKVACHFTFSAHKFLHPYCGRAQGATVDPNSSELHRCGPTAAGCLCRDGGMLSSLGALSRMISLPSPPPVIS